MISVYAACRFRKRAAMLLSVLASFANTWRRS
jgi:hypothetical protein